jgi:hypothetical protein
MWIEKLTDGVLQLDTPIGPRYVQPTLAQRVYLMWTFRNFLSLPHQVLHPWERRLIDRLWSENRFVSLSAVGEPELPVEALPFRKPVSSSKPAVAEQSREAASA